MEEHGLAILALIISAINSVLVIRKVKKPSLTAACLRGIAYAKSLGGTHEHQIRTACHAVIREDIGDNNKRDWPDHRIRQEVQALFADTQS